MSAKKVLETLSKVYSKSNLHLDSVFEKCLDDELELYWMGVPLKEALVAFKINESGDLLYSGIHETLDELDFITIPVSFKDSKRGLQEAIESQQKIDEDRNRQAKESTDVLLEKLTQKTLEDKKLQLLNKLLKQE